MAKGEINIKSSKDFTSTLGSEKRGALKELQDMASVLAQLTRDSVVLQEQINKFAKTRTKEEEKQFQKLLQKKNINDTKVSKVSLLMAQKKDRVNIISMPLSQWRGSMLKQMLKVEDTKAKQLFKGINKHLEDSQTVKTGIGKIFSPVTGQLGNIFSDLTPFISGVETALSGFKDVGVGAWKFFTGFKKDNFDKTTDILEELYKMEARFNLQPTKTDQEAYAEMMVDAFNESKETGKSQEKIFREKQEVYSLKRAKDSKAELENMLSSGKMSPEDKEAAKVSIHGWQQQISLMEKVFGASKIVAGAVVANRIFNKKGDSQLPDEPGSSVEQVIADKKKKGEKLSEIKEVPIKSTWPTTKAGYSIPVVIPTPPKAVWPQKNIRYSLPVRIVNSKKDGVADTTGLLIGGKKKKGLLSKVAEKKELGTSSATDLLSGGLMSGMLKAALPYILGTAAAGVGAYALYKTLSPSEAHASVNPEVNKFNEKQQKVDLEVAKTEKETAKTNKDTGDTMDSAGDTMFDAALNWLTGKPSTTNPFAPTEAPSRWDSFKSKIFGSNDGNVNTANLTQQTQNILRSANEAIKQDTGKDANVISAYRSFEKQKEMFEEKKRNPGAFGGNPVADPGNDKEAWEGKQGHGKGDKVDYSSETMNRIRTTPGLKAKLEAMGAEFDTVANDPNHVRFRQFGSQPVTSAEQKNVKVEPAANTIQSLNKDIEKWTAGFLPGVQGADNGKIESGNKNGDNNVVSLQQNGTGTPPVKEQKEYLPNIFLKAFTGIGG